MKERPILFSAPMIRALLAGAKTQTRRISKPQSEVFNGRAGGEWCGWPLTETGAKMPCPYGQPGDRLRVCETWATSHRWDSVKPSKLPTDGSAAIYYRASDDTPANTSRDGGVIQNWRPSIFLPTWASRITLEIESVRVERLQDISVEDALSEGITHHTMNCPKVEYQWLWESINGHGSWELNPWVWIVSFKRITS